MKDWFYLAGWGLVLFPQFLPFLAIITYLYSWTIVKIILTIFKLPKGVRTTFKLSAVVALISFCMFVLEYILIHSLIKIAGYMNSDFGVSPYVDVPFFICTLVSVCFCIYLSYILNSRFIGKYLTVLKKKRNTAILLIAIFTSPLIFFIPLEHAYQTLFRIEF